LNDTEKLLRDRREKAYISLDKSNEEKENGNQVHAACAHLGLPANGQLVGGRVGKVVG